MSLPKIILCTGPPGNGRDEMLMMMKEKSSFRYYHLFDYIVEQAKLDGTNLTKMNILDFYDSQPEKMESLRKSAILQITKEIKENGGVNIISTPHHFEWKGNRFKGFLHDDIEVLNPDLFIVIFDDIIRVRERLSLDPQWSEHKYTLGEIANWRREEMAGIYEVARSFTPKKEVQIIAYENGSEFLKDLIYNPKKQKIYLSHPITGEGSDFFKAVNRFAANLKEYYKVFDPSMIKDWEIVEYWRAAINTAIDLKEAKPNRIPVNIEYKDGQRSVILDAIEVEAAIKNLRFQIIDTDYKLIENSQIVVVYHPRQSISAGVMCEMVYAKSLAKMVYVFYPYEPSPFFEWYSTRIFKEENELKEFLIKESKLTGQTPLDIY
ncbi:AAA family ATPase [Candidatus Bathyarchaeota archaeon]|nr:AAA family ATPase [Candidatus Bathyarchaeota archaeon]